MEKYVAIIGAANVDIGGASINPLNFRDSNPGHLKVNYGGVGRNIAHNLALLGVPVKLISVVGDDLVGSGLVEFCTNLGIDMSHTLVNVGNSTSMYLYINQNDGDLAVALSDIKIDALTPEYLASVKDVLDNAAMVVVDMNVAEASIAWVEDNVKAPIFIDPVSVGKCIENNLKGHLKGIDTIKPNEIEASFLTDMTINTEADAKAAARALLDIGIRRVFLSMGRHGIIAAERNSDGTYHMELHKSCEAEIISTTGAGDSSVAAIIWSLLKGCPIDEAARYANAVAALTIESSEAINSMLSEDLINKKLGN